MELEGKEALVAHTTTACLLPGLSTPLQLVALSFLPPLEVGELSVINKNTRRLVDRFFELLTSFEFRGAFPCVVVALPHSYCGRR